MKHARYIIIIFLYFVHSSCENFVEVDVPNQKIVSETVFSSNEAANNAVRGIYNELFKSDFSNGNFRSVSLLGGLSARELTTTAPNEEMIEFEESEILIENSYNLALWSSAYNIIYLCNAVIDGLRKYNGVSEEMKVKLTGEVQFVRAFVYFYLVNLYGKVPLILSPDYRENALASRTEEMEIYETIIDDLENAIITLGEYYESGERIRPNKYTAMALMARVYLFLEDWEKAETYSTQVINSTENYALLNDLDQVFLANSQEAIWQISPAGRALSVIPNEPRIFILTSAPPQSNQPTAITKKQLMLYSKKDIRSEYWLGVFPTDVKDYYYPTKYRIHDSEGIKEYSMVMRLAEQYFIRAEAKVHLENLTGAITDLDKIRERANLDLIMNLNSGITGEALLDSIQIERQRELFTEWGHRWLDIKRTGMAPKILSGTKTSWQDTDVLYPIPEEERSKNPNLTQNNGY